MKQAVTGIRTRFRFLEQRPAECRLDCRGHNQPVTGWADRHPVERPDQATTGRNVQGNVVLKGNRHEIFILSNSNPTDADDDDCSPSA